MPIGKVLCSAKPMILFLLIGPPLSYMLALQMRKIRSPTETVRTILQGMGVWAVAFLLYLLLRPLVPLRFDRTGLYLYFALHDFVYWIAAATAGFLIVSLRDSNPRISLSVDVIGGFLLGIFLAQPVIDLIESHQNLQIYDLFLLPALRIVLILALPALLVIAADSSLFVRILLSAAIVSLTFLAPLVPFFAVRNLAIVSYALVGIFSVGAIALFLVARRYETR